MRSPLKLSALLALLLLAFTMVGGTGVGAQESTPEGLQPADLDGIQNAVSRTYALDYSAMMEAMATPGAEPSMPTGIVGIGGVIIEFDSDDNAAVAFEKLQEDMLSDETFSEDSEVAEFELDAGDQSTAYAGTYETDGQLSEDDLALVQAGNAVYVVYASGIETDVQPVVTAFVQHLIDAEGSGAGEFNEDGTSTGGLWDKFPADDDELVAGLITYDAIVYPQPETTPEA
jgi:hypothetical protein